MTKKKRKEKIKQLESFVKVLYKNKKLKTDKSLIKEWEPILKYNPTLMELILYKTFKAQLEIEEMENKETRNLLNGYLANVVNAGLLFLNTNYFKDSYYFLINNSESFAQLFDSTTNELIVEYSCTPNSNSDKVEDVLGIQQILTFCKKHNLSVDKDVYINLYQSWNSEEAEQEFDKLFNENQKLKLEQLVLIFKLLIQLINTGGS